MLKYFLIGLLIAITIGEVLEANKWPWRRRIGRHVRVQHKAAYKTIDPKVWPEEPNRPDPIDPLKLRGALSFLCGRMPVERLTRYTETIIREANQFDIDPFLLGALMYDSSGCRPRTPYTEKKFGLTRIDVAQHRPHIRNGKYRYFRKENGAWRPRKLIMDRYPFTPWMVRKDEQNLYFAAALLQMFSLQCPDLDEAFGGAPHRHPISHWFYGDVVRQAEPESRVLTIRRRLITYYHNAIPKAAGTFRGAPLYSPLDGAPRLIIDFFGSGRDHNPGLAHRGIDIDGLAGEPVRTISPGRVIFSGMDMPGSKESRQLPPCNASDIPNRGMGRGGLYVRISHENGFHSLYMHLRSTSVVEGTIVNAGDQIGSVGSSGTTVSGPHLHLELRVGVNPTDPAIPLQHVLANPFSTHAPHEIARASK
jgi:murein DD-endopeptidase MepM/ murein hydrolase activator NlpD